MDREACHAAVHGVTKSRTRLRNEQQQKNSIIPNQESSITKEKGAGGQGSTHLSGVLELDTFSKSSWWGSGGPWKRKDVEKALTHPLNHSLSTSPPERNINATTVTSKCAGRLWLYFQKSFD